MPTYRSTLTFNSAENVWEPRTELPRSQLAWRLQHLIACALLALLLWSVLAFGAVYPAGILTLQLGAAALFFASIALQFAARETNALRKPTLVPLLALGAIVAFQMFAGKTAYWYASYQEALLWTAYLLVFLVASAAFHSPRTARITLLTIAVFGPLVALFGIVQSFASNGLIYWFHAPYETSKVMFGPYVNRNHYAGMVELLAPFPLVLAFHRHSPRARRALWFCGAALMYASVLVAASRGGALACFFQVLFFALLARSSPDLMRGSSGTPTRARSLAAGALVLLAIIALALWIEPTQMLERLSSLHLDDGIAGRPTMFRDAIRMLGVHPFLGFGLHTFPTVYPAYRSFSTELFVNELHNDWLQMFVELGFAGGIALLAFVYLLLRDSLRLIFAAGTHRARPGNEASLNLLRIASLTGVAGLLLHSFGDFNLHIPANAACFFALCAWCTNVPVREMSPTVSPAARDLFENRVTLP